MSLLPQIYIRTHESWEEPISSRPWYEHYASTPFSLLRVQRALCLHHLWMFLLGCDTVVHHDSIRRYWRDLIMFMKVRRDLSLKVGALGLRCLDSAEIQAIAISESLVIRASSFAILQTW